MSFFIGSEMNIEKMNRSCFEEAAKEVGLGNKMAMKHFDQLAEKFEKSLQTAVEELESQGFHAEEFSKRIIDHCGYHSLQ